MLFAAAAPGHQGGDLGRCIDRFLPGRICLTLACLFGGSKCRLGSVFDDLSGVLGKCCRVITKLSGVPQHLRATG